MKKGGDHLLVRQDWGTELKRLYMEKDYHRTHLIARHLLDSYDSLKASHSRLLKTLKADHKMWTQKHSPQCCTVCPIIADAALLEGKS